jgi:hypothetical protein
VTEQTFDDFQHNEDLANNVLDDIDDVLIALDKLGWMVVCKNSAAKWPMNRSSQHCPSWCESAEEQDSDEAKERRATTTYGLNTERKAEWNRQHIKVVPMPPKETK